MARQERLDSERKVNKIAEFDGIESTNRREKE